VAVDPLSRTALMALGKALMRTGKLEESEQKYRSVAEIFPDFPEAKYALAMVLVEQGRLDRAEPWLRAVATSGDDPFITFQAAWVYVNLGLLEDAHKVTAAIRASPGKELGEAGEFAVRGDWAGMLAYGEAQKAKSPEPFWPTVIFQADYMLGRYDAALAALGELRPDLLSGEPTVSVLDLGMPVAVEHVLRAAGHTVQADKLANAILAATAPRPGIRTVHDWRMARARVFADRGQAEAALAELEAAEKAGWRTPFTLDSVWLDQDPTMAAVHAHPRFRGLMARVKQDLVRQRAAVLAARSQPRRQGG
jgi:tetratricopeptide (TPR) repeat protein